MRAAAIGFLWLMCAPALAAPLRLDEVLASVEQRFPLLKAAELEKTAAASDLLSAEGGFDLSWKTRGSITPVGYYESVRVESTLEKPTALWGTSVFAGWRLGTGTFTIYDGRAQTLDYGEARAGINVPLWRNGPIDRRRATLERSEMGVEIAKLSVTEQQIQFRRAAAHRYWAWVAAGERLHIAKTLLANVEGRDSALVARIERGDIAPIERTDNERAIEQRKVQVALAQRGIEQAGIELGLLMRNADGTPVPPPDERLPTDFSEIALPAELPSDALRTDVSLALEQRPEAKKFKLQFMQNQVEANWANNQIMPSIDLQLAGSQDIGPSIPSRPDLRKPVFEISLLVDLPLQTRLMQGRVEASVAAMTRLNYQQDFARERIDADVRDAYSAIRLSRERVEAARREVQLATTLENAERTRFNQGDSHLLIVNIREQQTAEAEFREIDALLDYYRATADLKAARGE